MTKQNNDKVVAEEIWLHVYRADSHVMLVRRQSVHSEDTVSAFLEFFSGLN